MWRSAGGVSAAGGGQGDREAKSTIRRQRASGGRRTDDPTVFLLSSCTWRRPDSKYCDRHPQGWDILPPTRSAQLTTRGTFSFKFGRIDIRAKTAAGDWLMSKLVLDPKASAYGSIPFESGRMEMLRSRGNADVLEPSGWQLGARLNDPQADIRACDRNLWLYKNCPLNYGKLYSEEMRVFSLVWTPESITMTIDGECEHIIRPPAGGFLKHDRLRDECYDSLLERGTHMAPFDKEFYIYIGLLVAGFNNYLNEVISKGNPKPWNDRDPRAWLKFWQQRHLWEPTWISDMEVDYVKVWAL
ncbi:Beta-1,3-glucan-binding protein [Gryllus bimaculatus]|nr:Beta-1,3-glucan-binding protein [Gryllus bimaculatus]